jgi:cyclin-dependent kinase-like
MLQILEEVRCPDVPSYLSQPERVRFFMYQLLRGLEYMHSLDLIHRDLKPENLLINSDDTLKICDFGFTRTVSNGKMTDYVATRWYRSPELLLSRDDYDKSVDIWAAGCIFAEMIDSEPLFPGESEVDQLYLMQRCLGPLSPDHQEFFLKHPRFVGIKFPEVSFMIR